MAGNLDVWIFTFHFLLKELPTSVVSVPHIFTSFIMQLYETILYGTFVAYCSLR